MRIYHDTTGLKYNAMRSFGPVEVNLEPSPIISQISRVKNKTPQEIIFNKACIRTLNEMRSRYQNLYAEIDKIQNSFSDRNPLINALPNAGRYKNKLPEK